MTFCRLCNWLTILSFLAVIAVPPALTSTEEWDETVERRQAVLWPALSLAQQDRAAYTETVEKYLNDHIGLRRELINFRNYFDYFIFHKSPTESIIIGENGYLYYTGHKTNEDFSGSIPFNSEQLNKLRQTIDKRRKWLAERGILYLMVVAPNKQTIYPEFLPDYIRSHGPTRANQLAEYVHGTDLENNVIFLAPRLIDAKGSKDIYFHLDSHWNSYGAYIGYQGIVESIRRNSDILVDSYKLSAGNFVSAPETGGDLPAMMGLPLTANGAYDIVSDQSDCSAPAPYRIFDADGSGGPWEWATDCKTASNGQRLLFFQDSFGVSLRPFFSRSFSHTRGSAGPRIEEDFQRYVNLEKPTIVIEEIVERNIDIFLTLPDNIPANPSNRPHLDIVVTDSAPTNLPFGGYIDQISNGQAVSIQGWGFWQTQTEGRRLVLGTNLPIKSVNLSSYPRQDVVTPQRSRELIHLRS